MLRVPVVLFTVFAGSGALLLLSCWLLLPLHRVVTCDLQQDLKKLKEFQYFHGGIARAMDPTNTTEQANLLANVQAAVRGIELDDLALAQTQQSNEHGLSHRVVVFKVSREKERESSHMQA